jgi:hypothetical protein
MAGFEAIPKGAEEAHLDFGARGFSRAMLLVILVGTAFYKVGSLACAVGWMSACAACWRLRTEASERALALVGMLVAAAMVLMKLLPFVPGHFALPEYVALGAWLVLGLVTGSRAGKGTIATEARDATRT